MRLLLTFQVYQKFKKIKNPTWFYYSCEGAAVMVFNLGVSIL